MKTEKQIKLRLDQTNIYLKNLREWKAITERDINHKAYRIRGLSIEKTTLQMVLGD